MKKKMSIAALSLLTLCSPIMRAADPAAPPAEGEHGKNVTKGMNYLLSCVRPDGYITNGGEGNMYNHGIAAIALAELYGQTKDPKLKQKLDLAIKLIVNCQNQQGGWRYRPAIVDGDISVTVLQLVAAR